MPDTEIPSVVCAWCGHTVRKAGSSVSHGICTGCTRRLESGAETDPPGEEAVTGVPGPNFTQK